MRTALRIMATCAAAVALTGASVTVAEAQTAGGWKCDGAKVSRCIQKVGTDRVQVNIVNKTYTTVVGRFGLTCGGPSGQRVYELKKNLSPRGGYLSGTITCPAGSRDYAFAWQITASTYYSPTISI